MIAFLLVFLLKCCDCVDILVFAPSPMYSHQVAIRSIYQELAERGHNITVITGLQLDTAPKNYTEIFLRRTFETMTEKLLVDDMKDAIDIRSQQISVFSKINMILEPLLSDEMKELIVSGRNFDLVISEVCARSGIIFSEVFQAQVVLVSSYGGELDTFSTVGSPVHPILYPIGIRENFHDLTPLERVVETYRHYEMVKVFYEMRDLDEGVIKKYLGERFPSLDEINMKIDLILLNVHPLWDSNRPVASNLIYLGGLHLRETTELPQDLKDTLDASDAVYMSFGSTVRSSIMNREKVDMFLRVLSKIPFTVLWKWDGDVDGVPQNVIVRKWFPQADLLRHPRVKLFITQGGLQSVDEVIAAAVPMVGVPILFDQWYNVDKIVELEVGVMCNIRTVTEEEFQAAVNNVLTDKRYGENIGRLRSVMYDKTQTSLERAVHWIEYVLEHKSAKHLRPIGFNITTWEYFEIDLVLSIILFIVVSLFIVIRVVKFLFKSLNTYCNLKS